MSLVVCATKVALPNNDDNKKVHRGLCVDTKGKMCKQGEGAFWGITLAPVLSAKQHISVAVGGVAEAMFDKETAGQHTGNKVYVSENKEGRVTCNRPSSGTPEHIGYYLQASGHMSGIVWICRGADCPPSRGPAPTTTPPAPTAGIVTPSVTQKTAPLVDLDASSGDELTAGLVEPTIVSHTAPKTIERPVVERRRKRRQKEQKDKASSSAAATAAEILFGKTNAGKKQKASPPGPST